MVVPASAGVIPACNSASSAWAGLSRVSGGDPDGTTVRIFDKKSFPRERGTLSSMAVSEDIYLAECVTQIADDLLSIFMR